MTHVLRVSFGWANLCWANSNM